MVWMLPYIHIYPHKSVHSRRKDYHHHYYYYAQLKHCIVLPEHALNAIYILINNNNVRICRLYAEIVSMLFRDDYDIIATSIEIKLNVRVKMMARQYNQLWLNCQPSIDIDALINNEETLYLYPVFNPAYWF